MRIAVCTAPLSSGHKHRGTGTYTKQLTDALFRYEKGHTYLRFDATVPHGADLVHYPFFDPFFLTLPLVKPKPTIVTVHDLIPISFADHFPRGLRGEIKWQVQRFSLTRAVGVITDSLSSKYDINKYTGIPDSKLHVIYLSPPEDLKRMDDKTELSRIQKKYDLPPTYILYIGDVNWNKNIPGLIKAFNELTKLDAAPGLKLVLGGNAFCDSKLPETSEINRLIEELKIRKSIIMTGYIPDADLAGVYSLASAYVQPSFAEGFGLPVLEAMSCGVPVASSSTSSLKEIAGPSILFNPADIGDMAKAIGKTLKLDRSIWQREGAAWLKQYSWKKVASETVKVYKQIVSERT